MKRTALTIINEYANSDRIQLRRNACSALAALGTEESLTNLANISLTDSDESVRKHSELEIAQLDPKAQNIALKAIRNLLEEDELTGKAYTMLARLSQRGVTVTVSDAPPWKRLATVWNSRKNLISEFGAQHWKKLVLHSTMGTLVGWITVIFILDTILGKDVNPESMGNLLSLFGFISVFLATIAGRYTLPFSLHFDFLPAGIVEAVAACRATTLAYIFVVILLGLQYIPFLNEYDDDYYGKSELTIVMFSAILTLLLLALYVASIRLGTVLSIVIVKATLTNRFMQALVGGLAGMLVLTICCVFLIYVSSIYFSLLEVVYWNTLWVGLLPGTFGLGWVYAYVDNSEQQIPRKSLGKIRKISSSIIIGTFFLLILIVTFRPSQQAQTCEQRDLTGMVPSSKDALTKTQDVVLMSGCSVSFTVDEFAPDRGFGKPLLRIIDDYGLTKIKLERKIDRRFVEIKSNNYKIESELEPGDYQISTEAYNEQLEPERVLPELIDRFLGVSKVADTITLTVSFTMPLLEEEKQLKEDLERLIIEQRTRTQSN